MKCDHCGGCFDEVIVSQVHGMSCTECLEDCEQADYEERLEELYFVPEDDEFEDDEEFEDSLEPEEA